MVLVAPQGPGVDWANWSGVAGCKRALGFSQALVHISQLWACSLAASQAMSPCIHGPGQAQGWVRAHRCSRGPSQDTGAVKGFKASPCPCSQCRSCREDGLHVWEIKTRISAAMQGTPESPPCQPLAQLTQTWSGKTEKQDFLPTLLPNAPSLHAFKRTIMARWWGGPRGCRQPWDKCCPPLLPALHCNLPLFSHCFDMD